MNSDDFEVEMENQKICKSKVKLSDTVAIQKKKQDKMIKEMIEKQNLMKEQGWTGRIGGMQVQGRCRNKRGCRSPATKRKHNSDQNKHELTYEGNSCAHENDQETMIEF